VVDAGQREMPEGEPHVSAEVLFDLLDRVEGLPRVGALVVAVLEDQVAGGRAANVIGVLLQRRQAPLEAGRYFIEGHGRLRVAAGGFGWLGGLEADGLADEDDVDAAGQLLVALSRIFPTLLCCP